MTAGPGPAGSGDQQQGTHGPRDRQLGPAGSGRGGQQQGPAGPKDQQQGPAGPKDQQQGPAGPKDRQQGSAGPGGRQHRDRPGTEHEALPEGERLQKVLARAGIASRRAAEELIAAGRVTVNGSVASLGRRVDIDRDRVALDGAPVPIRPGLVYYLLNKPAGVMTTASDPEGRPTVVDLVPADPRVFPVGRLDFATEGLLVLTNDGEITHHLTHPRFGVAKEYLAVVEGHPSPADVRRLREGVDLEDGRTAPARVNLLAPDTLRIVIHEGRNRQVRRMCDAVGHPVQRLVRTRIGPLTDRRLAPGAWRPLTQTEVRSLAEAATAGGPT